MQKNADRNVTMEEDEVNSARAEREKTDKKSMNTTFRPLLDSSKYIVDEQTDGEQNLPTQIRQPPKVLKTVRERGDTKLSETADSYVHLEFQTQPVGSQP